MQTAARYSRLRYRTSSLVPILRTPPFYFSPTVLCRATSTSAIGILDAPCSRRKSPLCTAVRRSRRWYIRRNSPSFRSLGSAFGGGKGRPVESDRENDDCDGAAPLSRDPLRWPLTSFDPALVRNFCIIAHVDHGKSSLASRLHEYVHSGSPGGDGGGGDADARRLASSRENISLLDTLPVERRRGITVKSAAASLPHRRHLLNMVDTPGHSDFSNEVARTLRVVDGCVLAIDAVRGVQAQTLGVYGAARRLGLPIVPVLTKVDVEQADPLGTAIAAAGALDGIDPDKFLCTSARTGEGVGELLDSIVAEIPAPNIKECWSGGDDETSEMNERFLKARVVDSFVDPGRGGVVCLLQVLSGILQEGERIVAWDLLNSPSSSSSSPSPKVQDYSVQEVGVVMPDRVRTKLVGEGMMAYMVLGIRDPRQATPGTIFTRTGDLQTLSTSPEDVATMRSFLRIPPPSPTDDDTNSDGIPSTEAMTNDYGLSKSVLYATVHAGDTDSFDDLVVAVDRLALNDTGLEVSKVSFGSDGGRRKKTSGAGDAHLGPGLRVGFQGLLHMSVFQQRLQDEFAMDVIITPPKVPYSIAYLPSKHRGRQQGKEEVLRTVVIEDISQWPSHGERFQVKEPVVSIHILAPSDCAGKVMALIKSKRGFDMETSVLDDQTWTFMATIPWAEVVTDFNDRLKNITAGYGSFDTGAADPPMVSADLNKVEILLNGELVEPLAFVCHKDDTESQARTVCQKLKELLPREQFLVVIQGKAAGKIIASERIKPYRKDVLTKGGKTMGGGDITRKKKLLEKQKAGKKRQAAEGKVRLSQEALTSVMTR